MKIKQLKIDVADAKEEFTLSTLKSNLYHAFIMSPLYDLYVLSGLQDARYNLRCWLKRSNYVRTDLPLGYYDKETLMEEGVFQLVVDYIAKDQENAHSYVVIPDDAMEVIIDILHFVHIRKPAMQKRIEVIEERRRKSAKFVFTTDGRLERYFTHSEAEHEALIQLTQELENKLHSETQMMLKKCIDVRPHLYS